MIIEADRMSKQVIKTRSHVVSYGFWYGLIAVYAFASCSPLQLHLHEGDLKLLSSNPTIYVVTFKPPAFDADTSTNAALIGGVFGGVGGAVGGALGALAAGAVSNASAEANRSADIQSDPRELVRAIIYEDPAKQMRDDFVGRLQQELKLSKFVFVGEALQQESSKALGEKFQDGLVLGFKTEEWVLALVPLSSDYWIKYRASALFYLPQEKRYLWREICGFARGPTASLAELAANSGEGLKYQLKDTATRCAQQLAAEIIERLSTD